MKPRGRTRTRGTGTIFRPTYKDKKTGKTKTSTKLWIQYFNPTTGKHDREPVGSTKEADAEKLLQDRQVALRKGDAVGSQYERATLGDLQQMLIDDYVINKRKSLKSLLSSMKHLLGGKDRDGTFREGFFDASQRARSVTEDRLAAYVAHRIAAKAANASIKLELSHLHRMFTLGALQKKVARVPSMPQIKVNNRRKGFFESEQHAGVKDALPPDFADLIEFLWGCGWRSGEAMALEWTSVDERAQVIRIEDSKNDDPRTLPYGTLPEVCAVIAKRAAIRDELKRQGRIVPYVFHVNGERIKSYKWQWQVACVKAGLGWIERAPDRVCKNGKVKPGRILKYHVQRLVHDYRRTAARDMSRARMQESTIMKVGGWKTRSVFDRYRIVNEAELAEGLARLAQMRSHGTGDEQREQLARQLVNAGVPERLIQELLQQLATGEESKVARISTFSKR